MLCCAVKLVSAVNAALTLEETLACKQRWESGRCSLLGLMISAPYYVVRCMQVILTTSKKNVTLQQCLHVAHMKPM